MKFLSHTIVQGETLQSISQYYYKDANRWSELALLNELEYPFITDELDKDYSNVKKIGETIVIPVENPSEFAIIPSYEFEDIYEKAFGQDISLFGDGSSVELTREASGEMTSDIYGDIQTVKGIANLRQAIIIRLATPLGSLIYHPTFGSRLHELIGSRGTFEGAHKIKVEVERCVRSDKRVDSATVSKADLIDDCLDIEVSITPMGMSKAFILSFKFGEGGVIGWG